MSINESWLNAKSNINIPNYTIVRQDRVNNKNGGGVCLIIHRNIRFTRELLPQSDSIEYVLIKIKNQPKLNEYLSILTYYAPPSTSISKEFIKKAFSASKNLILLGDLNAHHSSWHSVQNNQSGIILDEILNSTECTNINYDLPTYQPTHRPDYYAVLDFVICSDSIASNIINFKVTDLFRSDHLTLEFDVQLKPTCGAPNSKVEKTIHTTNWDQYQINLLEAKFERPGELETKIDIDKAADTFVDIIRAAIRSASKSKTIRVNPNKFIILPSHIVDSIKNKRKARRKYQKTHNSADKTEFNRVSSETKQLIEEHKRNTWKLFCNSLNFHSISDAKLWRKLDSIDSVKQQQHQKVPILKQNNNLIDNPIEIANIFASLLAKTFSDPGDPNFDDNFREQINKHNEDLFINNDTKPELTNPTELQQILDKLKPKGAPGADQITNKALKKLTPNCVEYLVDLINASIRLAHLPCIWKHANITMIPKPMKVHSQPENFRPISLLNTLSKLCERVIQIRVNRWLSDNNINTNYQSGFSKGKQTNDHLFRFIESTLVGFNRGLSKGLKTAAIFIDIEKAFDNVWHTGLLYKLNKYQVPIPNYLGNWLRDYLSNRTFQVKCDGKLSITQTIQAGVPQGSVLGPTLFNIFFNDISEIKEDQTELGMFADDVITWIRHQKKQFIQKKLQDNLLNIQKWSSKWRLKISATKTTFNIFNFRNVNINNQIKLAYNKNPIKRDPNPKFLGVTLDQGLRLNKHIENVIQRAQRRINTLKRIKGRGWGAKPKLIITTFKSLIRSIIEYAPFIPSIIAPSKLSKLEAIQRRAVKIALGWPANSLNKDVQAKYASFKLEPIVKRSEKLSKKYLMKSGSTNPLIKDQIIESKKIIHPEKCPKRSTILSAITFGSKTSS